MLIPDTSERHQFGAITRPSNPSLVVSLYTAHTRVAVNDGLRLEVVRELTTTNSLKKTADHRGESDESFGLTGGGVSGVRTG